MPEGPGSEPLNAEDVHIDYGKFYGPEEQKEPEAPLTFYEQSKPAYQPCTARGIRAHPGAGAACKSRRQQAFEQERAAHMKQKRPHRSTRTHTGAQRNTPNGSTRRG